MKTLKLYHGTDKEFNRLSLGNLGTNSYGLLGNHSVVRNGIFFTPSKKLASQFGKTVRGFYVSVKNCVELTRDFILDFAETFDPHNKEEREYWFTAKEARQVWTLFDEEIGKKFVDFIKSRGYDCATFEEEVDGVTGKVYVVFSEKNIVGEFTNESPDKSQLKLKLKYNESIRYKDFYLHLLKESKELSHRDIESEYDEKMFEKESSHIPTLENDLIPILDENNINYDIVKIPDDNKDYIITKTSVISYEDGSKYPFTFESKLDFVYGYDVSDLEFCIEEKFNKEFWESPATLYHATKDENVDSILRVGLNTTGGTGINNRSTRGVFAVSDPEVLYMGHYGNNIIEIDCVSMKRDGVTPFVSMEPQILEDEARNLISGLVEYHDYSGVSDSEGVWNETVIMSSGVDKKYLKLQER